MALLFCHFPVAAEALVLIGPEDVPGPVDETSATSVFPLVCCECVT